MYTARLNTVRNKFNSVSNNPAMETYKNLGNLQADLSREQSSYNSYAAQNSSLNSQFSTAQTNLTNAQANLNTLQQTLTNQQNLVNKVQSYLSDYRENNTPIQQVSNEELAQQLMGDLAQLNLG